MISVRLAKSQLENEEGMNHLWIHLEAIGQVENARIRINLPQGIYRRRNLSHFHEDDSGEIIIYEPSTPDDIYMEIFTSEAIKCERTTIELTLFYTENGAPNQVQQCVTLDVVDENEMNNVVVDEEVVTRIKELPLLDDESEQQRLSDSLKPKVWKINASPSSDLEKKYRIEG
ncbi:hypothetical protein [Cohnella abietis]|uniref:Uncharacterized protein n=1 Tax=Cohnella abietis TaxID=2507935 RepID=A0A3T1DBK5_9BACL|nr:hypothetical protein [Cohnella abietis]BBI35434.1 hypothetical protein KCTCHS21_48330 [Cohnella abietis]